MNPTIDFIEEWYKEESTTRVNLLYLFALHSIELLRKINVTEVDNSLAWQYGHTFDTIWKDDKFSITEFCEKNKNLLSSFIYYKAINTVRYLFKMTESFTSDQYQMVPIDQQFIRSVINALENCINNNTNLRDWCIANQMISSHMSNNPILKNSKTIPSQLADVAILDIRLRGYFNTYSEFNAEHNTEHFKEKYSTHRTEVVDNRFYICLNKINKIVEHIHQTCHNNSSSLMSISKSKFLLSVEQWSTILSTLFHLVIPTNMHPNNLDILYDKFVATLPEYTRILNKVRKYTHLPIETVLMSMTTPEICLPACGHLFTDDQHIHYNQSLQPDELTERYLVLYELIKSL